jgi:hypothetical protein
MSERETGAPDTPSEEDERLREAQEGKGYGEDEGERESGLERETGDDDGGAGSDREGDEPSEPDTA